MSAGFLAQSPVSRALTTLMGGSQATGVPVADAVLQFPLGLGRTADGSLIVSARRDHSVFRVDLRLGLVFRIAGTGVRGFSGDGGPATAAQLACPDYVSVDTAGNLYVSDRCNERIRRIDARTGHITTVAGNGLRGPAPDGPALATALTGPFFAGPPTDGVLLFTDTDGHLVRQLNLTSQHITTLAGNGVGTFNGDGGPARRASLKRPHAAMWLRNGDLLIADSENQRLRIVDRSTGIIRTLAGSGREGPAADGTPALDASFHNFGQVLEDEDGSLTFTEVGTGRLLRLDRTRNVIRVLAGTTDPSVTDRDGQAPLATRFGPLAGLVRDGSAYIVVEPVAGRLRRIDLATGTVRTLVGRAP